MRASAQARVLPDAPDVDALVREGQFGEPWAAIRSRALDALPDAELLRAAFVQAPRVIEGSIETDVGRRPKHELARIGLLVDLAARTDERRLVAVVEELYRDGDLRQQSAIARALPSLPSPSRFVRLARRIAHTNLVPVFEAFACENAFPARHLADEDLDQLVHKARFLGLSRDRIVGLRGRVAPRTRSRRARGRRVASSRE